MDATRKRFHHLQRKPPKHDLFIFFFFFFFPTAQKTPQDGRHKKKVPAPSTKTTKHDIAQTRGSRPTLQTRSAGGGGNDEPRSWELLHRLPLLLLLPLLSSLF
jgi:hypothetical protein